VTAELRYVYAIADASAAPRIATSALRGIDGGAVETIVEGSLLAATTAVSAADYEEKPLNEHLQDMDWLAPRAAAHQDVNAALLGVTDAIVPLSFGAIYRGTAGVRDLLSSGAASLRARLTALSGRAEWIVSVEREDIAGLESPALNALEAEIAAAAPGRAFLLTKRRDEIAREERRQRDATIAEATAVALGDAAEQTYREPLIDDSAVAAIARFSALVKRADEPRLRDAIDRVARDDSARGYHVRLSGPWPAYRFGGLPLETASA
jgi:gas vesicle protein GvpL/GvpF